VVIAFVGSKLYNTLLLLHIAAAIVGFGGVVLNGVWAAKARQAGGSEGLAISKANFEMSQISEYCIYSVPVFGILLALTSGKVNGKLLYGFQKPWVSAAIVLYVVAIAVSHAVLIPGHKQLNAKMGELVAASSSGSSVGGPPSPTVGAEMQAIGKRMAPAGAFLDLALIVMLYLMIFKPGQ
jgi:hypothetical protein